MDNKRKVLGLIISDPKELACKIFDKLSMDSMMKWNIIRFIPDSLFLKIKYKRKVGKSLNLNNPKDFNEKLQWLKLNDRKLEYITWVDKYSVRDHVKMTIGEKYLNELIGIYSSVEEIKWEVLPEKFVLKCTHGSGCNIICPDKKELNIEEAKYKLKKWMSTNYYYYGREWPYKNVKPRIVCEEFIQDDIVDYKFYCFNGEPKFLYTSHFSKNDGHIKMDFYDINWEECDFYRGDHEPMEFKVDRPLKFEEMLDIAKKLSNNIRFARIDLFYVNEKIYFSEITLTPGSGFTPFLPDINERLIGDMIKLT